jgi:hypothetical protein
MKDDVPGLTRLDQMRSKRDRSRAVREESRNPIEGGVTLDDFDAYMPQHRYIFEPTREMWLASSVNARTPANSNSR